MKTFFRVYGVPLLIVILGLAVAVFFMAPAPPSHVSIAGGAEGGAYAATAVKYADALRAKGIEVDVVTTNGAVDNLQRLKDGKVDIGVVQTGIAADAGAKGVRSLGAIFYEPLWVFYRGDLQLNGLQDVAGKRAAVGPDGSGANVLATLLLKEAGVAKDKFTASPLAGQAAATALKAGEVDVAMVVSGATTAWIADLVADPNIRLLSLDEANAFARRHPYLDKVTLYRGVLDLAAVQPRQDIQLIAPAAQIAVREGLHPAIQSLLLDAAFKDNVGGSILADAGRFPTPALADIPISEEAERYYKGGPTFLRSIFPYSVANFLERAWVLAIPLITLLIPLVRAAPPLYRWRIRRKIYVWYTELRRLEGEGRAAETVEQRNDVRSQLADIQAQTGTIQVPLSYTDDLYRLRSHIRFVSELVDRLDEEEKFARV